MAGRVELDSKVKGGRKPAFYFVEALTSLALVALVVLAVLDVVLILDLITTFLKDYLIF